MPYPMSDEPVSTPTSRQDGLTERIPQAAREGTMQLWHAAPDSAFMSGHLVELVAAVDALEAERTPREPYQAKAHGFGATDDEARAVASALNQAARDGNGGDR